MADKVAFVYNNSAGSDNEPIAMIVLKNGMVRFHAPKDSSYRESVSELNGTAITFSKEDAEEMFEDYADKWDNRFSLVDSFPLQGKNARRAEVLIAKWSK